LVAAAFMRANHDTLVLPFEHRVVELALSPKARVMENASRLASLGGGGTDCSAPLQWLNRHKRRADLVVMVSDNESWIGSGRYRASSTLHEWEQFRRRNPAARLVCLDIQPYATSQAPERDDILNIGGFSDAVFSVIEAFHRGGLNGDHWIGLIEAQEGIAA
jgi:60 kDa SS-A/Ro ribonucleoprotein